MIELVNTYQLPWLMMGDFNELLESTDKIGGRDLIPSRVQAFDNCLKWCGFFELASSGPNCTWTNKSWNWSKHIKEKLDKAFCNNEWQFLFPQAHGLTLLRTHSDHHLISVSIEGWNTQKPHYTFIFQPMWLTHASFRPIVDCYWNSHNPHVMESQNFTTLFYSKIHLMQSCLTRWNSETFGEIGRNKKKLMARILGIQKTLCTKHSRFLLPLEWDLIHQYNMILYQEYLLWQMKSRMLWLTYEDVNSKFFQLQTKIWRARQHIATLKDDTGEWL